MDKETLKGFTEHLFRDMAGAMAAGLAYVGIETGLFKAMAGRGSMSVEDVVEASRLDARYVEEWLKGMACAGYLSYSPEAKAFELPEEHAYLLASEGTDHFAGGLFCMVPPLLGVAPKVAEAFRRGGGVSFEDYGEEGIQALDLINRGNYENRLVSYWLEAMPDVVERLERGGCALDIGCGTGHVSLVLAKAFPNSRFQGIDLDRRSIERANRLAQERDLHDRVSFEWKAVESLPEERAYDLVTACDCVHDLTEPIATLRAVARRLKRGGTLFIIEPRASDRLEDDMNPLGAMFYGFSVFHCLTQSLAQGGAGLGTCMGPAKTRMLVQQAGFTRFEQLDIRSQVNLFYAARR